VEFTEVTDVENPDFDFAINIYTGAFPANERHPANVVKERVKQGLSQLYVGRSGGDIVFMALLWPLKNTDFILLDYMATTALHRGKNIGSRFLQHMRKLLEENRKYFVLEVENPEYGHNKEERNKRIAFYKRNGAKELKDVRYILPPLQGSTPTEMTLMIYPGYKHGKIDGKIVKNLIRQIYQELYNLDADDTLFRNSLFNTDTQVELI
jgi:GNAT superfamily N-acetyltransferase